MLLHHLRMAEDATQDIVEVMGNTTAECAHRLHAAGLLQARLQSCALFFHGMPLHRINDGIKRHPQQTEFAPRSDATRSADRVKTQGDAGTVFVDTGHARPSAEAKRNAGVLVLSYRHATDARNMDNSIDGGAEPSRKRRGALRPTRQRAYARFAPHVQPRRCAAQYKIGAI